VQVSCHVLLCFRTPGHLIFNLTFILFTHTLSCDILNSSDFTYGAVVEASTIGMTRKECIIIADQFVRSAFKGMSTWPAETCRSTTIFAKITAGSISSEDEVPTEQQLFLRRRATKQELKDAETLMEVMRLASFDHVQAKLIYFRAYHRMSWKRLAEIFSMSWDGARGEYDDCMHLIYYRAKL